MRDQVLAAALLMLGATSSAQGPAQTQDKQFGRFCAPDTITIPANEFVTSDNVGPAAGQTAVYGAGRVVLNAPPYNDRSNSVTYHVDVRCSGRYVFSAEYAAATPRPVQLWINGTMVMGAALNLATGGWMPENQRWQRMGEVLLRPGVNVILLRSGTVFPHVRTLRLEPVHRPD